jgi:hypothetical protein
MPDNDELRSYELEFRAKYSAEQLKAMLAAGEAIKNANGEPSYPIGDRADLENAIRALGRGSAPHADIKAYIVKRATALKATDLLPADWRSADDGHETRTPKPGYETCPDCEGTGTDEDTACDTCDGSGQVEERNADHAAVERRKQLADSLSEIYEHRDFMDANMELRENADGTLKFRGWASVTDTPYTVGDFTETIARGSFKRSLGQAPDVSLLVNHTGLPLARTSSGTLRLEEDERGLRVEADLCADDPDVQQILPKLRRGDLSEMSFAFRAVQQEWSKDYSERTIRECALHRGDCSIVTNAANPAATGALSIRSANGEMEFRVGKAISTKNEKAIKDAIDSLANMITEPEDDEPVEAEPYLPRSYIETAKAHKARIGGKA